MTQPIDLAEKQIALFQGGEEAARTLITECMEEIGLASISSAQDLLRVSMQLVRRGGLIEVVGRSLKVTAILMGGDVAALPTDA